MMSSLRMVCVAVFVALASAHEGCMKSQLPFDLDLINMVERIDGREVHLSGEYRVGQFPGDELNVTSGEIIHNLDLNVTTEDTVMRISVAPEAGVEMRLEVWEDDWRKHEAIAHTSERHLLVNVTKDHKYQVRFLYRLTTDADLHCPTVYLEFATAFLRVAQEELSDVCDDLEPSSLDLDIVTQVSNQDVNSISQDGVMAHPADLSKVRYSANLTGMINPDPGHGWKSDFYLLSLDKNPYTTIRLPRVLGRRSEWLMKVTISANFLLGGGIGAVVTKNSFEYDEEKCTVDGDVGLPHLEQCMQRDPEMRTQFIASGGRGQMKNTYSLQTILTASEESNAFKLFLTVKDKFFGDPAKCFFYNLHVTLSPVDEEEDQLNCDSTPLPVSLEDAPGVYTQYSESYHLYANIGLDKVKGTQATYFAPKSDSTLRVYVEHATAELTLLLRETESGDIKAASSGERGVPQGIVFGLTAGTNYTLHFSESTTVYTKSWDEENEFVPFCDTFLARIDILKTASMVAVSEKDANKTIALDFSPLADEDKNNHFTLITLAGSEAAIQKGAARYAFSLDLSAQNGQDTFKWGQQALYNDTFTVTKESVFKLTIARDFVRSDVVAMLMYQTQEGLPTEDMWFTHNTRRVNTLDATLRVGTYRLILMTAFIQEVKASASVDTMYGADTADFSLDLTVYPTERATAVLSTESTEFSSVYCAGIRTLPLHLFHFEDSVVHIIEDFAIPYENTTARSLLQESTTDSILHLQVSNSKTKVQVRLLKMAGGNSGVEDSTVVTDEAEVKTEELYEGLPWMMATLKADTTYALQFTFEETELRCESFTLQLSVAPKDYDETDGTACNVDLPQPDLFSTLVLPYTHSKEYTTDGRSVMQHTHINFQIYDKTVENTGPVVMKVLAEYDFKFQHIYLDICKCKNEDFTDCWECGGIRGAPVFNGEMITPSRLIAGYYVLKVYESDVTTVVKRADCEKFRLSIWMDTEDRQAKEFSPGHNCTHLFLPKILNIPGLMGRNGKHEKADFHTLGNIRIDHRRKTDSTRFEIFENNALVKAFVPPSYGIPNVQIKISLVDAAGSVLLEAKEGTTLEMVVGKGWYSLVIDYDAEALMPGQDGTFTDDKVGLECVAVPVEISIVDVEYYTAESFDEACKAYSNIPATISSGTPTHGHDENQRPVPGNFAHITTFSFGAEGGRVEFDLRTTFETGSLHFHVMRKAEDQTEKQFWKHYYPQRYLDREYLYLTLDRGEYEVHFHNTSNESAVYSGRQLSRCQKYSLHMSVTDFAEKPNTNGDCPALRAFPEEMNEVDKLVMTLYRNTGYAFVKSDVVEQGTAANFFPLTIPKRSVVRVWTHTHNTEVDIDIEIRNEHGAYEVTTQKSTHVESLLGEFHDGADGFFVAIYAKDIPAPPTKGVDYDTCEELKALTSFDAAVAVASFDKVVEASLPSVCDGEGINKLSILIDSNTPDHGDGHKPLTLRTFSPAAGEATSFTQKYAFDKAAYATYSSYVIVVPETTSINVEIRFDFLLAAVKAELFRGSTEEAGTDAPVASADAELDENEESSFDASTVLRAELTAGTYHLRMHNADREEGMQMLQERDDFCIPFAVTIQMATQEGGSTEPTASLSAITPLALESLLPTDNLNLALTFSEKVSSTLEHDVMLRCRCADGSKTCKKDYNAPMTVVGTRMLGKIWDVSFAEDGKKLEWDSVCTLDIPDGAFKTEAGDAFAVLPKCGVVPSQAEKDAGQQTACRYVIPAGKCRNSHFCYPGASCADLSCQWCGTMAARTALPEDGVCPPAAAITNPPTTKPEETEKPAKTLAPTPLPTPVPGTASPSAPRTKAPTTSSPPVPPPTPAPSTGAPTPTDAPPKASSPPSSSPPTPSPPTPSPPVVTPDTGSSSTGGEPAGSSSAGGGGSGGSSTGTILLVLLVVTVLAAGVYFGYSKGMFNGNGGYVNPNSYSTQEDGDELFEESGDDTEEEEPTI